MGDGGGEEEKETCAVPSSEGCRLTGCGRREICLTLENCYADGNIGWGILIYESKLHFAT